MDHKERVKSALELKVPDRIPYGEFAIDFDTIEKILGHETYLRAKARSQIAFWEGRRDEVVQSWKEDFVELYRKLDCIDLVNVCSMASGIVPPRGQDIEAPKKIDENTWVDDRGVVYKLSEITKDITVIYDPDTWTREYRIEDYMSGPEDDVPDESIFEVIDHIIGELGSDRYILGTSGTGVEMTMLGNLERALPEYILNPGIVKAAAGYNLAKGDLDDKYYIRKGQDGILWGQDFAYKTGPMISPEMFREFAVPYTRKRVENIREKYGLPVIKHACGNNWKLLDMFVEIGYACYQSIQGTASMDIKEVKEAYGDKICLWGGVSLENLVSGTKEDVKKDVRYAVENARKSGGYIFGTSHSIAVGTKYDNYMTMLDEFEKIRDY